MARGNNLDEDWIQAQGQIVQELGHAMRAQGGGQRSTDDIDCRAALEEAVQRAVQCYRRHYEGTGTLPAHALLTGMHASAVERVFLWMGRRERPSMALQLLYALMGHQIQEELEALLELESAVGKRPAASLAALSALQLTQINDLQTATVREEDRIDQEMAKLQQSLADQSLTISSRTGQIPWGSASPAALFDLDTTKISSSSSMQDGDAQSNTSFLSPKLSSLQNLCLQADSLCLSTFEKVIELLNTPYQKAQFLLASAKLQVALGKLRRPP